MDLQPESLLKDRYKIIQQLGSGGMGAVYLAEDTALDHQVAVKVNQNANPEGVEQFLREARLLASLRHPNLPRVIDYFLINQDQFLVMDFIPGDDLGTLLARNGAQPLQLVIDWAQQLGNALNYLHNQSPPVIHRDIKPANIKLTPQGEAILVDFGIAKLDDLSQATSTGAKGLTPGFSPPEQYGSGRTGHYSDQYSLAATIYHLLSNQKPVDSVERLLGQAILTPLKLLAPGIPDYVAQAVEKAMSIKPEDRFVNIHDFIESLTNPDFQPGLENQNSKFNHASMPQNQPAAQEKKANPRILGGLIIVGIIALTAAFLLFRDHSGTESASIQPTESLQTNLIKPTKQSFSTRQPTTRETQISNMDSPTPGIPATRSPSPTPLVTATPEIYPVAGDGLIAFSSNREDQQTLQIWTMNVSFDSQGNIVSGNDKKLTSENGDKIQPAWSPDGKQIVFCAPAGLDDSAKPFGTDLWIMDADGGNLKDLANLKGNESQPVWSPDGTHIIFTGDNRADGILQLYMINPDGSGLQRLSYDLQEFNATWSPDNAWLAFVMSANNAHFLWMRSSADLLATPVPFDKAQLNQRIGEFDDPTFSPDGEWIAYTRLKGLEKNITVVKFATRGNDIFKLTSSNVDESPAWSPNSQWLLFSSNRDGNSEIYIMNAGGQMQTNLTNDSSLDVFPAWKP